ncbi:hypothetical protein [Streptomyces sp. MBT53]|nr:hypothetical protein [Streptomyces sp. MBT53]MBK6018697.1 hypothetical protein [Streptomyces sp. MBT53]
MKMNFNREMGPRSPKTSPAELNKAARELRLRAGELEKCLEDGRHDVVAPKVRGLQQAHGELTYSIRRKVRGRRRSVAGAAVFERDETRTPFAPKPLLSEKERAKLRQLARVAREVANDLLSKEFTDATLREAAGGVNPCGAKDGVLPGERMTAFALDVASYATLETSNPEAVGRKGVTVATRNCDKRTKMAVSVWQYALGPSPLKLFDDTTKILGEAVRGSNAKKLKANMARLADLTMGSPRRTELQSEPEPEFLFTEGSCLPDATSWFSADDLWTDEEPLTESQLPDATHWFTDGELRMDAPLPFDLP